MFVFILVFYADGDVAVISYWNPVVVVTLTTYSVEADTAPVQAKVMVPAVLTELPDVKEMVVNGEPVALFLTAIDSIVAPTLPVFLTTTSMLPLVPTCHVKLSILTCV